MVSDIKFKCLWYGSQYRENNLLFFILPYKNEKKV